MSIVKRLKREARKNPAKATILAGLCGVAVYFWAPLLSGAFTSSESSKAEPREQPTATAAAASPITDRATKSTTQLPPEVPWRQIRQWRDASPWTKPADLTAYRDPFQPVEGAVVETARNTENDQSTDENPEEVVKSLPIKLAGTIVGPRRRVALLNGQAYREGENLLVDYLGSTWELTIREIGADRVTLAWQSIEILLTAPERPSVGRIELVSRPN